MPRKICFYILSTRQQVNLDLNSKTVLGRVDDEAIDVRSLDLSPFMAYQLGVSRRHAMLVPEDDRVLVFDLSSRNGTYLNGTALEPRNGYEIGDGDELRLGSLDIRIYFDRNVPYADMQTKPLPELKRMERHQPTRARAITAPLPDIRETLADHRMDVAEEE